MTPVDPTAVILVYAMDGTPIEMAFDLRMVWYFHWKDRGKSVDKNVRWEATVWNKHDQDYMEFLTSDEIKDELISQWRDVIREGAGITVR